MIKIELLKNHSQSIPRLANIWREVLGKIWMPEIEIEEVESLYHEELKHEIPLTYIALYDETPVGSCTLELNSGIRPDIGPWIGDLVVTQEYQKQGIGKMLLDKAIEKAKQLNFKKLYLFTFDPSIPSYYEKFGWKKIGTDKFNSHPVTLMEVTL